MTITKFKGCVYHPLNSSYICLHFCRWAWVTIHSITLGSCFSLSSNEPKASRYFVWNKMKLLLFFSFLPFLILVIFIVLQGNTARRNYLLADRRISCFPAFFTGRKLTKSIWPRLCYCHLGHHLYHRCLMLFLDLKFWTHCKIIELFCQSSVIYCPFTGLLE